MKDWILKFAEQESDEDESEDEFDPVSKMNSSINVFHWPLLLEYLQDISYSCQTFTVICDQSLTCRSKFVQKHFLSLHHGMSRESPIWDIDILAIALRNFFAILNGEDCFSVQVFAVKIR